MKNILKIQKDGLNTLKDEILSHSNSKLKKIYIIASSMKESGYNIIEECLIDLKAKKFIALGVDKKNTTKKMLENVLKYTKSVYIWNNNADVEINANIFIFEYEKEAYIYLVAGNITDSSLETDRSIYTKIIYDLKVEKKDYDEYVGCITNEIKHSFIKLTDEYIDKLVEEKLVFTTRQYMHVVPSIAELLEKSESEDNKNEKIINPIPKVDISADDLESFEIDLGEISLDLTKDEPINHEDSQKEIETSAFGLEYNEQEIESDNEYVISDDVIDMEALVLDSKVVKIDKKDIVKSKSLEKKVILEKQVNKKINLSNVSNIIMELAKKPTKGRDIDKIKIPNYIRDIIPNFFEIMEEALFVKSIEGEYKEAKIKLEIIDVNTSNKYTDLEATLKQKVGQPCLEFGSEKLADIMYEEMDIARVIKLAKDSYHIEIIPQGIEEYNLWYKLCTNNFKGSNRQYGLM